MHTSSAALRLVAALAVGAAALGVAEAQASDQTRIVDSRAAVVRFNAGTYTLDEDVGTATTQISLIARTRPNTGPPLRGFSVTVSTRAHTATSGDDYARFSRRINFGGRFGGNWVAVDNAYESEMWVAVRIVVDQLDEDDETFGLLLSTGNAPLTPIGVAPADLAAASRCTSEGCESFVTIVDDDTRGVAIGHTGMLPVREGGDAAYSVALESKPTDDVTVTPQVRDVAEAEVSVSGALTFTPTDWDRPQKVTVAAAADENRVDGSAMVTHAVAGGDYGDNGVTGASVAVREEDSEADLVLSGDVAIAAKHATALGGIDEVAFTVTRQVTADYDLDVPVTLSAGILESDKLSHTVTIHAGSASAELVVGTRSLDPDAATGDVTATVGNGMLHDVGDPSAASVRVYVGEPLLTVRLDRGSYTLDESVGRTTDEIGLIARTEPNVPPPTASVAMSLSAMSGTAEVGDDYQGFFAVIGLPEGPSGDWTADGDFHTARVSIPVKIIDDGLVEGSEEFRLRLDQASWLTATISLVPADSDAPPCTSDGCDSLVTIIDDDTRAVIVDQTGPLPVEEGGTAAYTVVLDSEPTDNVTVTPQLAGISDADLAVSPALTFTSDNWDRPQTVTVTASSDGNFTDGSATITHTVSGGDYESNGVTAPSVQVVEQDAESGAVVVTLVHVPDGTVIPDNSNVAVGGTVVDGTTFGEDEQVLFRLLFSAAGGGPAPGGADVELTFEWIHHSPIVPTSGQISRIVLSLPRVDVWDSAVQILDNGVGNPDSTLTIRITGCERNGCVIGEPSEITVTIADDDGGPEAAPPGQPATPWLQCPDRGNSAQDTGLEAIWEAPDFVGGAPIDHYELRYRPQTVTDGEWQIGGEWQAWPHHSATTSTVISGLESDVLYGVQVRAVNANGPGQWSPAGFHRTGQLDEICDILDEFAPVSSGRDR